MGYLSLNVVYVDGTKEESRANRYSFVWRKSMEKNKAKLEMKIRKILEQIEEGIACDNTPDDEAPRPINAQELKERIAQLNRENRSKQEQKDINTLQSKHLSKLEEYEKRLQILGNRNSYSKTDPSATFMRMKDDHMKNGQLKAAYNLQIGTENQFITHYDFYPNPSDTLTLIPFLAGFRNRYNKLPGKCVADSGYGSQENYEFMQQANIKSFVKYNYFHAEQKRNYKNNPFLVPNLYYNPKQDYYVCPMGQHMHKTGQSIRKSANGYVSQLSIYQAGNCTWCPLRGLCHKAQGTGR